MKHMRIVTAFAFATVFAASCGQQAQPPAMERSPAGSVTATSNSIRQALNELGDLLIGRWRWEINLAVDYPGVGKKGEQVVGFETCRWIADRNAIECAFAYGKATETRRIVLGDPVATARGSFGPFGGQNRSRMRGRSKTSGTKKSVPQSGSVSRVLGDPSMDDGQHERSRRCRIET